MQVKFPVERVLSIPSGGHGGSALRLPLRMLDGGFDRLRTYAWSIFHGAGCQKSGDGQCKCVAHVPPLKAES